MHEKEFRTMKFQAGLKGIDLEGSDKKSKFEEIKEKAQKRLVEEKAKQAGTSAEAIGFAMIGIELESE